jgi:hypothetical protein
VRPAGLWSFHKPLAQAANKSGGIKRVGADHDEHADEFAKRSDETGCALRETLVHQSRPPQSWNNILGLMQIRRAG